jgi:predicted nucleic acid-binding protein
VAKRPSLVIDASAALYVVSARRPTEALERYDLCAPPNYPSERTSAITAAAFRGAIDDAVLERLFELLEALPVRIVDEASSHRRQALDLARSLGWAKTYDAEYVALAVRLDCALLTTDERLARGARDVVRLLRPTDLA